MAFSFLEISGLERQVVHDRRSTTRYVLHVFRIGLLVSHSEFGRESSQKLDLLQQVIVKWPKHFVSLQLLSKSMHN